MIAKEHLVVHLHLAHRVDAHTYTLGREGLTRHQRRYQGALPAGVKAPTVIAALDLAPIEAAGAERHPAMRTRVAQCEHGAGRVATNQDRLAEHDLCQHRPAPQASARHGVIPGLLQWRGRVLRGRCPGGTGQRRVDSQIAIREPAFTARLISSYPRASSAPWAIAISRCANSSSRKARIVSRSAGSSSARYSAWAR